MLKFMWKCNNKQNNTINRTEYEVMGSMETDTLMSGIKISAVYQ
jgi:hypothetical protein